MVDRNYRERTWDDDLYSNQKFYERPWFTWLMMFVCLPLGIILLVRYDDRSRALKGILSIFFVYLALALIGIIYITFFHKTDVAKSQQRTDGNVDISLVASVEDDQVFISGETNLPDGALLLIEIEHLEASPFYFEGILEIQNGSFNGSTSIAGAPSGNIEVWVAFSPGLTKVTQPQKIIDQYGEIGELLTGENVMEYDSIRYIEAYYTLTYQTEFSIGTQNIIATLDPEEIDSVVYEGAVYEWPDDQLSQEDEYEHQMESFYRLANLTMDDEDDAARLADAYYLWGYDFIMVEEEVLAYEWLNALTLDTEIEQTIFERVESEWSDSYAMIKYEFEVQLEGYQWLENLTIETEEEQRILQEAMDYWEDDYAMIKYEFENEMSIPHYD
ncbi:hypothetical protein [Amphibacillus sediminis]|uniref:hypothetical protein n=1 Tax=Amphibacillus sediminis TaxID=360185 RepID=UPI000832F3DC|nr:hypothetical protein [Amphibacillus sediminis]